MNIEANIGGLAQHLSLNRAVQEVEIVPQMKVRAAHPSNDVEGEVKMFEEGAWQLPDSAQKGPGRPIIADERAQESMRVSNAWTQNHSQRVSGSIEVRSSGRL